MLAKIRDVQKEVMVMPPSVVKTIRDEIFWQYAKLISKSAGLSGERGFQMQERWV